MQSRETRFWLRFDSGARQGERVPLSNDGATVGRRSDNAIVVSHSSISGHHAEIRIEDGQVTLVDLDSTNGTRVGGEKITTHRLAHGDRIVFGAVQLVFVDGRVAPDASVPSPAAPGEELSRVSAEQVARSASRSKLGLVLVALLIASGGLIAWRLLDQETSPPSRAASSSSSSMKNAKRVQGSSSPLSST